MFMIEKGCLLFDELIVAVGINPNKKYSFTREARIKMLRECSCGYENARVDHFENRFLVDYAESVGANYILRGIRSQQDYEFERAMRNVNEDMNPNITTIFLMPPREICEISSSFVKGMIGPKGWQKTIKPYVPEPVYRRLVREPVSWHRQSGGAETASD
jgi:pantetheine-phosphate adenylyltransferase